MFRTATPHPPSPLPCSRKNGSAGRGGSLIWIDGCPRPPPECGPSERARWEGRRREACRARAAVEAEPAAGGGRSRAVPAARARRPLGPRRGRGRQVGERAAKAPREAPAAESPAAPGAPPAPSASGEAGEQGDADPERQRNHVSPGRRRRLWGPFSPGPRESLLPRVSVLRRGCQGWGKTSSARPGGGANVGLEMREEWFGRASRGDSG